MPYIITTTTPDPANAKDYGRVGDATPGAPSLMGAVRGCWPPRVTRTAVATLEEARETALRIASKHEGNTWSPAMLAACRDFPGEGTVGPLRDGTVIEVRPMLRDDVTTTASEGRYIAGMTADEMVVAFNAA